MKPSERGKPGLPIELRMLRLRQAVRDRVDVSVHAMAWRTGLADIVQATRQVIRASRSIVAFKSPPGRQLEKHAGHRKPPP